MRLKGAAADRCPGSQRSARSALPTRSQSAALPPTERSLRRDQRRPAPVQSVTHSGPTQDRPETHAGPAPPRKQRLAASRHPAPRAPRDTGATAYPRRGAPAVWPALDRDAPRRLERESRPVGTREVRGGVRVATVLGNRDPNALRRPRGSSPPADRDLCRAHVSAAGAAGRARDWIRLLPPRSLQRTGQEASALPEPGGPAPRGAGRDAWARPFHARLQSVACGPLLEFPPGPPGCVVCRH